MPTSNGLFFRVLETPTLENVGWVVRVRSLSNATTLIGVIEQFRSLEFTMELNGVGAGSLTIDLESSFWGQTLIGGQPATVLQERSAIYECYEDGVLRFQFISNSGQEALVAEDEEPTIILTGPGIAGVLEWAKVTPLYPGSTSAAIETAWPRYPLNWSAMDMWIRELARAQARGICVMVSPLFTRLKDSAGAPWEVLNIQPEIVDDVPVTDIGMPPGENLLKLLEIHTGQNLDEWFAQPCEWFMWPGFKLDARKHIGVNRAKQVIFYEGQIVNRSREQHREDIANVVITYNANGNSSVATDSWSVANWNKREMVEAVEAPNDAWGSAKLGAVAQAILQTNKDQRTSWTIQVPYDLPGRQIFRDYHIGDDIGISRHNPNGSNVVASYRVIAISIGVGTDDMVPTLELTLDSLEDARDRMLRRRIVEIQNTYKVIPPTQVTNPNGPGGPGYSPEYPEYPEYEYPESPDGMGGPGGGTYPQPGYSDSDGGYRGRIFIQEQEPMEAVAGDFWLQIEP